MQLRQRGIRLEHWQSPLERMTCLQPAQGNRKGLGENSGQRLSDEVRPSMTAVLLPTRIYEMHVVAQTIVVWQYLLCHDHGVNKRSARAQVL